MRCHSWHSIIAAGGPAKQVEGIASYSILGRRTTRTKQGDLSTVSKTSASIANSHRGTAEMRVSVDALTIASRPGTRIHEMPRGTALYELSDHTLERDASSVWFISELSYRIGNRLNVQDRPRLSELAPAGRRSWFSRALVSMSAAGSHEHGTHATLTPQQMRYARSFHSCDWLDAILDCTVRDISVISHERRRTKPCPLCRILLSSVFTIF